MIDVLTRLHRLWYLILFLATICLVTDITLSSTRNEEHGDPVFILFPIALIADIPTVLIFAYGLWGKSNPFLLPTSSPKSNVCTRFCRGFGNVLLVCLWIMNTIIYSDSPVTFRKVLAGVAALIAILILVELIGSSRLGRQQRRVLKQQKRQKEHTYLDVEANGVAAVGCESGQDQGSVNGTMAGERIGTQVRGTGSDDVFTSDDNRLHEDSPPRVEIVRPKSVDAAQVIFNQQLMYEMYQRQYHQQHQQHLLNQQDHQPSSSGASKEDDLVGAVSADQEGKYCDLLQDSSYKIEIPIDGPLPGSSTSDLAILGSIPSEMKSQVHAPSAPMLQQSSPNTETPTTFSTAVEADFYLDRDISDKSSLSRPPVALRIQNKADPLGHLRMG
ncbi:hypothetical protein BGX28_002119 [Mortierella sp. GBA30]|nr:hypothetical protein BGX28_002119 [Mortierella sp. GBA30]